MSNYNTDFYFIFTMAVGVRISPRTYPLKKLIVAPSDAAVCMIVLKAVLLLS